MSDLTETADGLTARLTLAGRPANAFGYDIKDLILEVEYQSENRMSHPIQAVAERLGLHVHIYDAEQHQYQISAQDIPRPPSDKPARHELEFHHHAAPFAFWITRANGEIIFDTRPSNIPIHRDLMTRDGEQVRHSDMPAYPLVFSDQYLQLATAVPEDTNICGLGEVISTSGLRISEGTIATMWNRDPAGSPSDANLYGAHPFYVETRFDKSNSKSHKISSRSHGVFLLNSHGMDVLHRSGVVEYRVLGGTMDLYLFSGSTTKAVIEQYSEVVGKPARMPFWAFGFHLCRWGQKWSTLNGVREVVERMKEENIPLETVWSDLDYMDHRRNFVLNEDFRHVS